MSSPFWFDDLHVPLPMEIANADQLRDTSLGSGVYNKWSGKWGEFQDHHWEQGHYQVDLRRFNFSRAGWVRAKETVPGYRFETVLKGEMQIEKKSGEKMVLSQGQYHLVAGSDYRLMPLRNKTTELLVVYFSDNLLQSFGIENGMEQMPASYLQPKLVTLITEMLRSPYQGHLLGLYYCSAVTDILFYHLAVDEQNAHPELTVEDIALVRQADAILSADLSMHYKIPELCTLTGTNEYKLKRAFRLAYKTGIFQRLLNKRMEHAKHLLKNTSKSVREIAVEIGYDTHAGFITSFRKRFGATPLEWKYRDS